MDFGQVTIELMRGFGTTCLLFLLTLVMSIPLGLIVMFGSVSRFKPLAYFTRGVVWVIRGTPLMLQVFVVFYVPSLVFDISMDSRETAVLIAFVINYACYFSEIYRAGVQAIPAGQYEAGQVLGMTRRQIFMRITLMQVIRRILPPMGNEIITLVKDTSLARVISVVELIRTAEVILARYGLIWPLFYAGAFYLIFNGALSFLFSFIEKKMSYYKI